jgi:hypothetical protein
MTDTLTADTTTAFKLADAVTFHHLPTGEGGPRIRLYLETG